MSSTKKCCTSLIETRCLIKLFARVLVVSFIGIFLLSQDAIGQSLNQKKPSKVANVIEKMVDKIQKGHETGKIKFSDLSNDVLHVQPDGQIELTFHATGPIGANEEEDLKKLGATIVINLKMPPELDLPPVGMIQVWIPYDKVEAASLLPWVVAVTPPGYGNLNTEEQLEVNPINPIVSEGVALHSADLAHELGITGSGVNVGVISNGVAHLADAQALGELPAVTDLATGSGDEGTAMLEIVHDMAPDAGLIFHSTGGGTAGHVTALNNLAAAGANIIAEDLAFDDQPAFQQGIVAATREATADGGVPVHSSSGNRGNNHAARVQAFGTGGGPDGVNFGAAPPGCTFNPDNVVAIAPGGDTTFDVRLGNSARFTLQWSEPRAIFPTAGQGGFTDLNLYVMDAGLTQCLGESVSVQADGVGDTIEQVVITGMNNTNVKLVVDVQGTSSAVSAPFIDLRWRGAAPIDVTTRAGSNDPDKNYTGIAYSIGAVNALSGNLEGFSSAGPVDFLMTTICGPAGKPGPCAADAIAGPPAVHFQGLDFLGADGVSVSGVGGFGSPFGGTSAAAPHAAACEALVRQVVGVTAPREEVRERLARTATDFPPPGEDSTNGAGLLNCLAAVITADLAISKSDDPDPVYAGDELFYTIAVTNNGPDPVTGVVVTDTLPSEVIYLDDTAGCDSSNLPILTCDLGEISAGGVKEFQIKTNVPSGLVANEPDGTTVITNNAKVTGIGFDPDLLNNSTEEGTFVEDSADLKVTKLCKPDEPLQAGETAECTVFVDNLGPSYARNVQLTDTNLSDGSFSITSVTPSQGSCLESAGVVTCDLGDLPAATPTVPGRATVTIEITANEAMDINDVANAVSDTYDPDPTNNQAEGSISITAVSDLALTKSDTPDPVVAGETLTYTLQVSNNGPSTAVNVLVKDVLPAGVSINSVNATGGGSCNAGVPGDSSQPTTCTFDSLDALAGPETMTIVVTVLPQTTGTIHNGARVSSDVFDPDNSNDLAPADTTVNARADLVVTKTDHPDPVLAGETLKYDITITNGGPSTAVDVMLTDTLPSEVSFLGYTISNGSGTCVSLEGSTDVECDLNDLNPGEFVTVYIEVQVDPSVPDGTTITDTATVSSATADPDDLNNSVSANTLVNAEADMAITKDANFDTEKPNKQIVYTLNATNNGPSDALDVVVVDELPLTPKKIVYVFDTGNGACAYDKNTHEVTCNYGTLPAGDSVTVDIIVDARGSVRRIVNWAEVSTSTTDPDTGNDRVSKYIRVKGGPGIR